MCSVVVDVVFQITDSSSNDIGAFSRLKQIAISVHLEP